LPEIPYSLMSGLCYWKQAEKPLALTPQKGSVEGVFNGQH